MASFPNAVKTFTTKVDGSGNTIFASHVNDLQDEVNAIEDGLRNGTAPLNSSNSTFTHLSAGGSTFTAVTVSGGSTLQTLSVVSNSTFGGSIFLGGANSSAVASTATDLALVNGAALAYANAGNSSWGGMFTCVDLGAIASTTPVNLDLFTVKHPGALALWVANGGGGYDIAAGAYLRPTVTGIVPMFGFAASNFGSTAGDASRINVYWDSTNTRFVLENKSGVTVTVKMFAMRGF